MLCVKWFCYIFWLNLYCKFAAQTQLGCNIYNMFIKPMGLPGDWHQLIYCSKQSIMQCNQWYGNSGQCLIHKRRKIKMNCRKWLLVKVKQHLVLGNKARALIYLTLPGVSSVMHDFKPGWFGQCHRLDRTVWLVPLSAAAAEQVCSCPVGCPALQRLNKPTDLARTNAFVHNNTYALLSLSLQRQIILAAAIA